MDDVKAQSLTDDTARPSPGAS